MLVLIILFASMIRAPFKSMRDRQREEYMFTDSAVFTSILVPVLTPRENLRKFSYT